MSYSARIITGFELEDYINSDFELELFGFGSRGLMDLEIWIRLAESSQISWRQNLAGVEDWELVIPKSRHNRTSIKVDLPFPLKTGESSFAYLPAKHIIVVGRPNEDAWELILTNLKRKILD